MPPKNNYADLEIRIFDRQDRGYPVEITFNGEQEFPRGFLDPAKLPLPWMPTSLPDKDGERLFDWLLSGGELKAAWAEARGQQPRRRIRLRIDAEAPELHAIPWELLRDPGTGPAAQDLTAMEATPFSRYLAGRWVPGSPILQRPIKILVAVADPENLGQPGDFEALVPIDAKEEFDLLQQAIGDSRKIELTPLAGPCTLEAIEKELRKGYHVLHFVGHGQFNKSSEKARLLLADENNQVRPVWDGEIAGMLGRQLTDAGRQADDKLRLVFLSSCETATRSPADAFRGLAPKLIANGVPAVLAMQDLVPVETAHDFSRAFYGDLLEHGQVDLAANRARSALMTSKARGTGTMSGAAIPVLFMRLRAGRLFGERGMILGEGGESFWSTLLENIADKDCTPFLGPGVAADLLPTPAELAQTLASKFNYPFPDRQNLPRVAQFIGTLDNRRLRKQVLSVLTDTFNKRLGLSANGAGGGRGISHAVEKADWSKLSQEVFESEIHHQLADLELPLYLTTNFDNFMTAALESKAGKARRQSVEWRKVQHERYDLESEPSKDDPVVLHLFGTDDDLLSMVLTEDDHLDYLARISHDHEYFLPLSVNERLASTTLLFLGYRLEDLDLKVIMRGLLAHLDLEKWGMLHVAVQLESTREDEATDKEVIDYFQKYFSKSKIDIYWGSTQQFVTDLSARRQEHRHG